MNEVIRSNLKEMEANKDIARDINAWESFIKNCPTHVSLDNRR